MESIKCGDVVHGYVTGIKKYGVFVNVDGGFNGLIHISEISDLFVKNIKDYVQEGEFINAKVLEIDENNNLRLSIKNFDYSIGKDRERTIKETPNGFKTLEKKLPIWIDEMVDNINKNE